jgi:thiamine monophosphate kinase
VSGGEEYELLLAAPSALDVHAFAKQFAVPLTAIGEVTGPANDKGNVTFLRAGKRVDLAKGYDHFSL